MCNLHETGLGQFTHTVFRIMNAIREAKLTASKDSR